MYTTTAGVKWLNSGPNTAFPLLTIYKIQRVVSAAFIGWKRLLEGGVYIFVNVSLHIRKVLEKENAIDVCKINAETEGLVGHLPNEISKLIHCFLKVGLWSKN